MRLLLFTMLVLTVVNAENSSNPPYLSWIQDFGHDTFQFPDWIKVQMNACSCSRSPSPDSRGNVCFESGSPVDVEKGQVLTFCLAKVLFPDSDLLIFQ